MTKPPRLRPVPPPTERRERRLDSWKEIAAYLNRTVRTARRWEKTEGLPVHRHGHQKRDSVYAYESELDAWWNNRRAGLEKEEQDRQDANFPAGVLTFLKGIAQRRSWRAGSTVVVLLLVVGGVWFIRSAGRAALPFAMRDWVLVTDFANQTGDPMFEKSLWTAFTVSLQQSRHANILPRTRIEAALSRMGKAAETRIDEPLGHEICLREHLRGLVVCDIAKAGRRYALSARLVDPQTGETVRAYLEDAASQDEVISSLGKIAGRIRRDLGESLASIHQSDQPLPRVTTPSLPALKLYAEGSDLWRKGTYQEAVKLFESALEHDPGFGMAHAALGSAYWSYVYNNPAKGKEHYEKALQLSGRTTDRERLYIRASYQRDLGHVDEAVQLHKIYLRTYPDDTAARYGLGTFLMRNHRLEEAIEQLKEVLRVAPADASALVNLATSYGELGRSHEALPYYAKAFELEPGLTGVANLNHEYGFALVHSGNVHKAREVFGFALSKPDLRASGLRSLALLDLYEGKYRQAKARLRESILLSEARQDLLRQARSHLFVSILLGGQGDRGGQVRELDQAERCREALSTPALWLATRIGAGYARAGAVGKAVRILRQLPAQVDTKNPEQSSSLHLVEGEVALARGSHRRAVELLLLAEHEASTPETLASLAYAHDKAGQLEQAIGCYEKLIAMGRRALGWEPQQFWIAAHARLAEIRWSRGDRAQAAQLLGVLDRLWKEADPGLPLVKTVARLRGRVFLPTEP